jgi:SAM-dependent methyltransferase
MNDYLFLVKEIARGKSAIRATLNARLKDEFLEGRVLDLGSGGADLYSNFIPREKESTYELIDIQRGAKIDFETDALPYESGVFDTVLFLNVMEHLFNYTNMLTEIKRIKTGGGVLVGYVPFLMWYHPDPRDYFRYTHEALEKILSNCGYTDIVIEKIYRGPYTAAFQMIHPTVPKIIRPLIFSVTYLLDIIFRKLRAKGAERYVLGYYFKAK